MTTHYILLTASKIIQPDPTRPGGMVQAVLNPKHRKLIPATCVFTEEQATGAAVAEMGTHAIVFEESFDAVARALEAFQPGKTMGEHMAERAKAEPRPFPWGESQFSKYAAERAASGARHQGELSAEEELGQILQEAKDKLEGKREPRDGDLRIRNGRVPHGANLGPHPADSFPDDVFFEVRKMDEDGTFEWRRDGLVRELSAVFRSIEAATEACRLAGYSRRLVTE